MFGQAMVPGSCGELVQGMVGGVDFHITCPVDIFSSARVSETKTGVLEVRLDKVTGNHLFKRHSHEPQQEDRFNGESDSGQAGYDKVLRAITELVDRHPVEDIRVKNLLGVSNPNDDSSRNSGSLRIRNSVKHSLGNGSSNYGLLVELKNVLPVGKGMASSTADIGAAVRATASCMGIALSAAEIADIALKIEPTDGVLFDGIVLYDHVTGKRFETMGAAPPLEIVVLEPPNKVDTVAFNKRKNETERMLAANEALFVEAIEMTREALAASNHAMIGKAATLSARINQGLLFKPELDDIVEISQRRGALGVNVAHSGTVFGIILEKGTAHAFMNKIGHYVPRDWNAFVTKMIDGGVRSIEE